MARKTIIDLDCDATIKFEQVGQSVEGYFIGSKPIETEFGKSKLHVFKGEDGNFGIYGSAKLDEKLGQVPPGFMTFVTFDGKVKIPGGKTMKKFTVDFDDELSIDVQGAQINVTGGEAEESEGEEQSTGEAEQSEESNDTDEETQIEAEQDEDTEPKNPAKKVLKPAPKGAAPTVSKTQTQTVNSLLSKSKR